MRLWYITLLFHLIFEENFQYTSIDKLWTDFIQTKIAKSGLWVTHPQLVSEQSGLCLSIKHLSDLVILHWILNLLATINPLWLQVGYEPVIHLPMNFVYSRVWTLCLWTSV